MLWVEMKIHLKLRNCFLATLFAVVGTLLLNIARCSAGETGYSLVFKSEFGALQPMVDYFQNWFVRASETQAEQPHWITPLVTVTPWLEQELRYDQSFQSAQHSVATTNFGSGKGLELIPWYFGDPELSSTRVSWEKRSYRARQR